MPKLVLDLNDRGRPGPFRPGSGGDPGGPPGGLGSARSWRRRPTAPGTAWPASSPELLEAVADAEIYLGYGVPAGPPPGGLRLKWAHSGAAGVGSSLTPEMLASPVLFTNSKGIHGPPMGDTALGMILHFARGLDFGVDQQGRGPLEHGALLPGRSPLTEMAQSTCRGFSGFGGIGREVAKRARALGARVLAYDRGPEAFQSPDGCLWA